MKRRNSGSVDGDKQRLSNDLMNLMKKKSARSVHFHQHSKHHGGDDGGGGSLHTTRAMFQVLHDLKQSKSVHLVYTSPVSTLVDSLENSKAFDKEDYIRKKAIEPLWLFQEEAVKFIKGRESDEANLGASGTLYCDEMGLGKSRVILTLILEENQRHYLREGIRFNGPTLVVCVPILIANWVKEIEEKFPRQTFVYRVIADAKDISRCDRFQLEHCCDIVITTYTTLTTANRSPDKYSTLLFDLEWKRIVADEAHVFVDESTDIAQEMLVLRAKSKIAITGTPVRNKCQDLKTLVNFVGFQYTSKELIDQIMLMRTRETVIESQQKEQQKYPTKLIHCLPELKSVTKRIQLVQFRTVQEKVLYYFYAKLALQRKLIKNRRYNTPMLIQLMRQLCINPTVIKKLVLPKGLLSPTRNGTDEPLCICDLKQQHEISDCPLQRFIQSQPTACRIVYKSGEAYEKVDPLYGSQHPRSTVDFIWDPFSQFHQDEEFNLVSNETDIQQYRHLYSELVSSNYRVTEQMLTSPVMKNASGEKIRAMLTNLMKRFVWCDHKDTSIVSSKEQAVVDYVYSTPVDDRIIIFSVYTGILDGLERALVRQGIQCVVVTGRSDAKVNAARIQQFQSNGNIKVLLMTLKLGNMGLNLTDANHVLHADPWWNPWATEQGDFRIRRPGQLKPIHIVYFIMDETLEVAIMNYTIRKKSLLKSMLESSSTGELTTEDETLLFDYEITIDPLSSK